MELRAYCYECEKEIGFLAEVAEGQISIHVLSHECEITHQDEDTERLLNIIKFAPKPFGKTDSELAKEYRNWYFNLRSNLKASEQRYTPDVHAVSSSNRSHIIKGGF